jgi:protein gp37
MNKQGPTGIEWTDYTWNPVGGCQHGCRWNMPDGSVAVCYAETTAQGVASHSYAEGFEHHYWSPLRLDEPLRLKQSSRIFLDSMSDLMGAWVPDEQIRAVLDIVRRANWHQFQLLTKNAPRLLKFTDEFPPNLWVGCSLPPSVMFGKPLSPTQQARMWDRILGVLYRLNSPVRWVSFEPLSFDVALNIYAGGYAEDFPLEWAVIGAASNGRQYFQPDPKHVTELLRVLDHLSVPVFFKGNLDWSSWRAEFPTVADPVSADGPYQMSFLRAAK